MSDKVWLLFTMLLGAMVATDRSDVQAADNLRLAPIVTELRDGLAKMSPIDRDQYAHNLAEVLALAPIPAVTANFRPNVRGSYINTNDLGYRGTENYAAQIKRARRVHNAGGKVALLLGGAAGFGLDANDDGTTIGAFLEKLLQRTGKNIAIFNFAMVNYTVDEHLITFAAYGANLRPDIVIVLTGYEDSLRLVGSGDQTMAVGVPVTYPTIRSNFHLKFSSAWLDRRYDANEQKAADLQELTSNYATNLGMIVSHLFVTDGHVVIASQPIGGYRNACDRYKSERPLKDRHAAVLDTLRQTAREAANRPGATYIDLTDTFTDEPTSCAIRLFTGIASLTSVGQLALAYRLYDPVVQAIERQK